MLRSRTSLIKFKERRISPFLFIFLVKYRKMKRKNIKWLLCSVLLAIMFQSCYYIKQIPGIVHALHYTLKHDRLDKKTIKEYSYGEKCKFILKNDGIFIPCIINGQEDTLCFDTGCSFDCITRIVYEDSGFTIKPIVTRSAKAATKRYVFKQGMERYDIQTPLFSYKHYIGEMRYQNIEGMYPETCDNENISRQSDKDIIMGWSILFSWRDKHTLLLNFSDTTMMLLDSNAIYDTIGYFRVDSIVLTCISPIPRINLIVDSIPYKFLFGTGSNARLILSDKTLHRKEEEIIGVGRLGYDMSGEMVDTVSISVNPVVMYGMDTLNTPIYFFKSIKRNNMGLGFIKHFDWIIDRKRNVMYAKPISPIIKEGEDMSKKIISYETDVTEDGKLTIVFHKLNQEKVYPLGTIIKSVNGEAITAENICDYKKKLNNTADWSKLELEVELPQEKEETSIPEEPQNTKKSKKEKKK